MFCNYSCLVKYKESLKGATTMAELARYLKVQELAYQVLDIKPIKSKNIQEIFAKEGVKITKDGRTWREFVTHNNELYIDHKADYYICRGSSGYTKTNDIKQIEESIRYMAKKGMSMYANACAEYRSLGINGQIGIGGDPVCQTE